MTDPIPVPRSPRRRPHAPSAARCATGGAAPAEGPSAGLLPVAAVLALAAASLPGGPVRAQEAPAPRADHHAHLASMASAELLSEIRVAIGQADSLPEPDPWTTAELLSRLDSAGVEKAAALSVAYFFAMPEAEVEDPRGRLEAENDWIAEQVRAHPDRLVGFCSVNPLTGWAPAEVRRCGAKPEMTGLKLHFANSGVDLREPSDVERVRAVFAAAADTGLPIVVHMRTRRPDYGRRDAEIFIRELLPAADGTPVQVAHMAGWGGYDEPTDGALAAFAEALEAGETGGGDLWFDLSGVVRPARGEAPSDSAGDAAADTARAGGDGAGAAGDSARADGEGAESPASADGPAWWPGDRYERLARRIRQVGPERVLFGSDWAAFSPKAYLEALREDLRPELSGTTWRTIMANTAPWME